MKVLVEGKNLEVTAALRKHAERQAAKLSKIGKKIIEVRIFLETIAKKTNDPHANRVTFSVSLPGAAVVVRKEATDMYEAMVDAAKSSVRQVRKRAEKRLARARQHRQTELALG